MADSELTLFDAGVFIGALLDGDPRHREARPLVEAARRGELSACTTVGILCEVYAALTWIGATPPHTPEIAANAVKLLVESPSSIAVLDTSSDTWSLVLEIAVGHGLTARRVHDARHAATAIAAGVRSVYTYDVADWVVFANDGIQVAGPASVLTQLI